MEVKQDTILNYIEVCVGSHCKNCSKINDHSPLEAVVLVLTIRDPWNTGNFEQAFSDILCGCQALLKHLPESANRRI